MRTIFLFGAVTAGAWAQPDLISGASWSHPQPQNLQTVSAEGSPGGFATALRATTMAVTPSQPWTPQLSLVIPGETRAGQSVRFRFWARSANGSRVGLVHELNAAPNTKALDTVVRLTPEWKEYALAYEAFAFGVRTAALRVRLGLEVGTVEFTGWRLEDWSGQTTVPPSIGFDPYGGQTVDDSWRESAQERIRQIRMGGLRVKVVDAEGLPIHLAKVEVEQLRHSFRFGTAIADGPLFANNSDGEKYRATIRRLFNYAVPENATKWNFQNGNGWPTASRMLDWCAENGLPVRGHNLFWPSYQYLPTTVRDLRGQALRDAIEMRVKDATSRTRGRVALWDVINEAVTNTEVIRDGGRDLLWKTFQWAREIDPEVGLVYNDYNISNVRGGSSDAQRQGIMRVIGEMIDNGAPLTMLGDQGHMNVPLTPIARVLETWDELGQFGLPLEITEFDVVLGGIRDEEAQGKYLADYMTAAFSYPEMKSFLLWGFWDGAHWLSAQGGGMYRRDWSPRPMAEAYERLVLGEWWTREKGLTEDTGEWSTRGFLGRHRVRVTIGETTQTVEVDLTESGDAAREVVIVATP